VGAVSLFAEIMLALAGVVTVSTVSIVVVARVLYTKMRRSRSLNSSALRARAMLSVGRQHGVRTLRMRLAETLASGQAALDVARSTGSNLGELRRLFGRIRSDGAALDAQLVLLLSERDTAVLSEALPVAERRVEQVGGLVRRLRSAVAAGIGDATDDSLARLTRDLDREITALDAGMRELHTLNGFDAETSLKPLTGRNES
jgi:hypothetical protein